MVVQEEAASSRLVGSCRRRGETKVEVAQKHSIRWRGELRRASMAGPWFPWYIDGERVQREEEQRSEGKHEGEEEKGSSAGLVLLVLLLHRFEQGEGDGLAVEVTGGGWLARWIFGSGGGSGVVRC